MPHDPDLLPPAKSIRSRTALGCALVGGLLFGVLAVVLIGWLMLSRDSGRAALSHVWAAVTGRALTIDVTQPTVVNRIQRLQRLETVVYTMDKLVSGSKENPLLPDFLTGDCLLTMVQRG